MFNFSELIALYSSSFACSISNFACKLAPPELTSIWHTNLAVSPGNSKWNSKHLHLFQLQLQLPVFLSLPPTPNHTSLQILLLSCKASLSVLQQSFCHTWQSVHSTLPVLFFTSHGLTTALDGWPHIFTVNYITIFRLFGFITSYTCTCPFCV